MKFYKNQSISLQQAILVLSQTASVYLIYVVYVIRSCYIYSTMLTFQLSVAKRNQAATSADSIIIRLAMLN